MKKGQAALEFLITYGWAFMIILIMIGAISYFGVTNPDRFVADRCTASSGFHCQDYFLQENSATFLIRNTRGVTINVGQATLYDDAGNTLTLTCTAPSPAIIQNRGLFEITCSFSAGDLTRSMNRVELELPYYRTSSGSDYTRNALITLVASIEE